MPVILLASFIVLVLVELAPGNLAITLLGENATPEQIASVNRELGIDQPLFQRWIESLGNMCQLDFGHSLITGKSVLDSIVERLPVTLELAILSQALALLIAVPVAMIAACRPQSIFDRVSTVIASAFISAPSFLVALLLVYFVSVQLGWLPVTGWTPISESLRENVRHAILPVVVLALDNAALYLRVLRSDLIATLQEDYILSARAKRLSTSYILRRHALRPSSFSLLTVFGLSLGRLIGGTVIVETIFALPGLGRLLVAAILSKDYAVVQGVTLFIAMSYIIVNLVVDYAYAFLDPRVGTGRQRTGRRREQAHSLTVTGG